MPETDDLTLLIEAARAAGEIAKPFWRADPQKWDKEDNAGPVTEADLAVNAMLEERLQSARPDYGWLSEESTDTAERLSKEHVFIIDPIDGTRSFIEGAEIWAHSLAIAKNGVIETAVVYVPIKDLMFTASKGHGASLNGAPLNVGTQTHTPDARILAAKPVMEPKFWQGQSPQFQRHFRPSLAYRLALVAEGKFDGMVTVRKTWEWDVAAGALIVEEAGGKIRDTFGRIPKFNSADPRLDGMVAANPQLTDALCDALT